MTCAQCGSTNVTTTEVKEAFTYGVKEPVQLEAVFPKHTCGDCEFEFTDYVAEEARDRAVKAYLESQP